jgi:hypothetical protein
VLVQISVVDGEVGQTTVICPDIELPASIPADTVFTSLTFNSNVLFASVRKQANGDTLLLVDPCQCTATEIGEYSGFSGVNGITSNELQVMFGASSTQDVILEIDPLTAVSSVLNPLPGNWGSTGLTWSDPQDNVLYGINASDDRLYTFDGSDASSLGSIAMNANFSSVGIEFHPGLDKLYACGVAGQQTSLFSVDLATGTVSLEAANVTQATCDNLAAPFGPVDCIPQ